MATAIEPSDLLGAMISWEDGTSTDTEVIALFQALVANGMAWQLQGFYGRMAQRLIDDGLITDPDPSHV
jgi:hypothetical protein